MYNFEALLKEQTRTSHKVFVFRSGKTKNQKKKINRKTKKKETKNVRTKTKILPANMNQKHFIDVDTNQKRD
ncbi:hypothetical protein V1478_002097 [Vespula squamosa]|uniref:Uncharacterized protein n=1 Tax=Vespula squamosa TaxID=30214 RepID=A0ABD2BYZ7_VESSQ